MNPQETHALRNLQFENNRLKEENHDLRKALGRLRRAIRSLNILHHRNEQIGPQDQCLGA